MGFLLLKYFIIVIKNEIILTVKQICELYIVCPNEFFYNEKFEKKNRL